MNSMRHNDRALFFIDPWGYKEIRPTDLKQLISNEKIEILFPDALSNTFSNLTKNDCSSITNQIRQNKNLKEKMISEFAFTDKNLEPVS